MSIRMAPLPVPALTVVARSSGEGAEPSATSWASSTVADTSSVRIHFLGHASFVLEFDDGTSVLTDYGQSNAYGLDSPICDISGRAPDIVTFSHDHVDHRRPGLAFEGCRVLAAGDSYAHGDLTITPIATSEAFLDAPDNASFVFAYRGLRILHVGDAQAYIAAIDDPAVVARVKAMYPDRYDLVLLTIDGPSPLLPQAITFLEVLAPARAIPMHYWGPQVKSAFLAGLRADVSAGKVTVSELVGSDYVVKEGAPATGTQVISLEPSPYTLR